MSRMLWFTWRQQRTAAIGAAAAVAALSVSLVSLNSPTWPGAQWRLTWVALLAVPCLAGMFIGAPMFAAELEHGIHRLALTQSVTRLGLIVPRLVLVMAPLLAAGGLLGALGLHAYAHVGWTQKFDHQVPVLVAYVAFSLALGVAAGLVCGRTLPAMVVTFIGYVGVRGWIEGYIRPYYLPPLTRPVAMGTPIDLGSSDLVLSQFGSLRTMTAYEIYQPAERFWTFQAIESGIFLALAAILLCLSLYWICRRIG